MPAAASYEDIYSQTSSSSVSSSSSASSYLPADYMMFADSPLDSQRSFKGGRRSYHNDHHHTTNYNKDQQLNLKQQQLQQVRWLTSEQKTTLGGYLWIKGSLARSHTNK